VKLGPLRAYPEHDAAGLPDVNGWQVYGQALQVCVSQSVSQAAEQMFRQIDMDVKADLTGWTHGCLDDTIIWGAMLNSGAGIAALVVYLRSEARELHGSVSNIAGQVKTISDSIMLACPSGAVVIMPRKQRKPEEQQSCLTSLTGHADGPTSRLTGS
jgi:hypothetical protein